MFIKLGELTDIIGVEKAESCIPSVSEDILDSFRKLAYDLKKVAPKAEDFLYFSAVIMHSAEAAAFNDDGTVKLNVKGENVQVGWDKSGGTWRWTSNDPNIKPYKNSNGDIFPEEELIKAHKKWIHKPLCIDHKSSSVDHTRGFIVDTYYDRNLKRVIALCALDKLNYPDLARKVSTGMQTNVSMGTAVGKAICTEAGCHRVARTESDFCNHMKHKNGYGEINIDLNPLELSIVVNGADPKANIKNIIAAANTLNSYVESKSQELNKLADLKFTANVAYEDSEGKEGGGSGNIAIQATNIDQFKSDLDNAFKKLKEITQSFGKDTNDQAFNQSSGTVAMEETAVPNTDSGLAPPSARYASASDVGANSITELREVTAAIEEKLHQMRQSLDKLSNTSTQTQEENMSGSREINKSGYFQGTEEPTPGQAKYPKDPLNEKSRSEDKHMNGQKPFPEVGPVDGMHPSPESADPADELERKKMLARAEAEDRAMRRTAIVNLAKQALEDKKAYFQNGEKANPGTPTPGEVKYPVDKLEYTLREKDDKHMVGQKPFPGVGSVDGMHPSPASSDVSDELKRKQMMSRASLRARFVKAANNDGTQNLGQSAWEVFLGDKLLLTASVNELSGNRSEMLYDSIATREFGTKLIDKVKVQGADKVRSMVKSSQVAPGVATATPPAPDAAPAPDADPAVEGSDKGGGDKKDQAVALAQKTVDVASDLQEAVKALTGEQAEMGEDVAAPAEMGAAASEDVFSTSNLNTIRREINGGLISAMKEAVAELSDHKDELDMIVGMYDKGAVNASNDELVSSIVDDALNESKSAIADGFKLMTAFVKYARGTKAIVKRAEIEAELEALAEGDMTMTNETDSHSDSDLMSLINDTNADLDSARTMLTDDEDVPADMEGEEGHEEPHDESLEGLDLELSSDENDYKAGDLKPETVLAPDALKTQASFSSREGRAAMRAKLAADATGKYDSGEIQDMSKQKFSDMLDQANSLADGQTELDVKPADSLGLIETLPERNKAMMDVAKAPPKVRKEAESIYRLVSEGKLDPADLDALVAEGLDKDAVAYYKKFFGQVDGGSEFASELVKEHVKAQLETELNSFKVKMARAYELAYDMVSRGLCHEDRVSVSTQVDEIMKFNDEGFDTLKRVVAKHAPNMRKDAGRMPQVGMIGSGDGNGSAPAADDNLFTQLSSAFNKTSKKMF